MMEVKLTATCLAAGCRYMNEFDGAKAAETATGSAFMHAKSHPGLMARIIVTVWQANRTAGK